MGCVSSTLLSQDDEFTRIGASSSLGHHIVSLTSSTYGFLSLDPPSPTMDTTTVPQIHQARLTLGSFFHSPESNEPEVINSWELMDGLDSTADSFRFPSPLDKNNENSNPNFMKRDWESTVSKPVPYLHSYNRFQEASFRIYSKEEEPLPQNSSHGIDYFLDKFEKLCPPKGEDKIIIYTTTLRGIRKTFEECNAVRAAVQGLGIAFSERDISMDRSFREELREMLKGKESTQMVPPRVFVRGRYLGGAEEVMKILEDGCLGKLLEGLPKVIACHVCQGCGNVRFLPCFSCNGSCKIAMVVKEDCKDEYRKRTVVVRCPDCNENGLIICPICS